MRGRKPYEYPLKAADRPAIPGHQAGETSSVPVEITREEGVAGLAGIDRTRAGAAREGRPESSAAGIPRAS